MLETLSLRRLRSQRASARQYLAKILEMNYEHLSIDEVEEISRRVLELSRLGVIEIEAGNLPSARHIANILTAANSKAATEGRQDLMVSWEGRFYQNRFFRLMFAYSGRASAAKDHLEREHGEWTSDRGNVFVSIDEFYAIAKAEISWISLLNDELSESACQIWKSRRRRNTDSVEYFHDSLIISAAALAKSTNVPQPLKIIWLRRAKILATTARIKAARERWPIITARSLLLLSEIEQESGKFEAAIRLSKRAGLFSSLCGLTGLEARTHYQTARSFEKLGDIANALWEVKAACAQSKGAHGDTTHRPTLEAARSLRRKLAIRLRAQRPVVTNDEKPVDQVTKPETIILLHGTFAQPTFERELWFERGSGFALRLNKELEKIDSSARCWAHIDEDENIFFWSGENSWRARRTASHQLDAYVTELSKNWRCHIVAHSHGGNVAIDALKNCAEFDGTITTLGTPFFSKAPNPRRGVRKLQRFLGQSLEFVALTSAVLIIFFTDFFSDWSTLAKFLMTPVLSAALWLFLFLVMAVTVPLVLFIGMLLRPGPLDGNYRVLETEMRRSVIPSYLFINSSGDEAFRLLAALFCTPLTQKKKRFEFSSSRIAAWKWAKFEVNEGFSGVRLSIFCNAVWLGGVIALLSFAPTALLDLIIIGAGLLAIFYSIPIELGLALLEMVRSALSTVALNKAQELVRRNALGLADAPGGPASIVLSAVPRGINSYIFSELSTDYAAQAKLRRSEHLREMEELAALALSGATAAFPLEDVVQRVNAGMLIHSAYCVDANENDVYLRIAKLISAWQHALSLSEQDLNALSAQKEIASGFDSLSLAHKGVWPSMILGEKPVSSGELYFYE